MKLIEAIIKPVKLQEVESALQKIGIEEFMESALICHGRQKGQAMLYRGVEHMANFVEKVKLEIIAADDAVEVETDGLSPIEVLDRLEALVRERMRS